MKSFGPVITAMVTPFDEYNQLNISSLRKLIIHLLKHGSTSLVITGTTGEARAMVDVTMPPSATSTWAISPTASSQSWKTLRKASSYGRSRNASESAVITLPFAMGCAAMTAGCVEIVNRTHCRAANMASPAQTAASSRCNRAFLRRRWGAVRVPSVVRLPSMSCRRCNKS